MTLDNIYEKIKEALKREVDTHSFSKEKISIRCKALSAVEAIGKPEENDYPIIKGREVMVEAKFKNTKGHAFTDEFENVDYSVEDLLNMKLETNEKRASFISSLNAIFRYLQLCDKTVHCKDEEPPKCAYKLTETINSRSKVLLIGYQPRFLEVLASNYFVRVVDLDKDNIGKTISNVVIEPPEMTEEAIEWCNTIFATGSTVVNGTIQKFVKQNKPTIFYGVTISAAAKILGLKTYCWFGH